jgi:hypothetical protein
MPQGVRTANHHSQIPLTTIPHNILMKTWNTKKYTGPPPPAGATRGAYVQEFFVTSPDIFGYPKNNPSNGPPTCTLGEASNVNDFGTDKAGNIIVPDAFSGVDVWAPPPVSGVCGTKLGTISDGAGQASSAAALDAVNGTIVVGQIGGGSTTGVVTCTLASLSCTSLTAPNMSSLAGVAMDNSGNCYADAFDGNGAVGLWVFTGCSGTGTELTSSNGFSQPYYGGLSVDNHGNLVVTSLFNSSFSTPSLVTVYSGCATGTCTLVGGPFSLQGESVFAHLGKQNEQLYTTDISNSMVEVYAYTGHGTGLAFKYAWNNGLTCATNLCESAVPGPTSPK